MLLEKDESTLDAVSVSQSKTLIVYICLCTSELSINEISFIQRSEYMRRLAKFNVSYFEKM